MQILKCKNNLCGIESSVRLTVWDTNAVSHITWSNISTTALIQHKTGGRHYLIQVQHNTSTCLCVSLFSWNNAGNVQSIDIKRLQIVYSLHYHCHWIITLLVRTKMNVQNQLSENTDYKVKKVDRPKCSRVSIKFRTWRMTGEYLYSLSVTWLWILCKSYVKLCCNMKDLFSILSALTRKKFLYFFTETRYQLNITVRHCDFIFKLRYLSK